MIKKYAYIFLTLLLPWLCYAQSNLTQDVMGTVTDAQSGLEIPYAQILISGAIEKGTISDENGKYFIEKLPPGNYLMQVSYLGYEKVTLNNITITGGKTLTLDIALQQKYEQIKEIEVRAKKSIADTARITDDLAVLSKRSISMEQSDRFAGGLNDPSRVVISLAGVRNQGDIQTGITIRGNAPNALLWCVEGYEVQSPNHFSNLNGLGSVNMINQSTLKSFNFYTAAFPAQYGNATSGVFDIAMRQGNTYKHEFSFAAAFLGIQGTAEGPLSKKNNSSYLLSYRFSTLTLMRKAGYTVVGNDLPTFQDINYKVFYNTKKAGVFELFGIWGNSEIQQIGNPKNRGYRYEDTYGMNIAGVKHQKRLSENSRLVSALVYSQATNYFIEQNANRPDRFFDFDVNDKRFQFDTKYHKKVSSKHDLTMGTNVQWHIFNFNSQQSRREIERFANVSTLKWQNFIQQKYRVTQNMALIAGLHSQYFEFNKSISVEPRLGMELNYAGKHTFTAGTGLHSRLENSAYYGLQYNFGGDLAYLNAGLPELPFNKFVQPSRAAHFVVGNTLRIAKDLSLSTEIYYQHLYRVPISNFEFDFFSSINNLFFYYDGILRNDGKGRNYGVDFTLDKTYSKLYYFMLAGSLYESKYRNPDFVGWLNTRYNGNFIMNAMAGKDFRVGSAKQNTTGLSARMLWSGNNRIDEFDFLAGIFPFENRLSNYFRLDTRYYYTRNKPKYSYTLSLDVQNATNRLNETNLNNIAPVGIIPFMTYKVDF